MSAQSPNVVIFSRSAGTRDELLQELEVLQPSLPALDIEIRDLIQITGVAESARLVILDLEKWEPSDEMALADLRAAGYLGPVVILTTRLEEGASATYDTTEKIAFCDRRKNPKHLSGLVKRALAGADVTARKHPRHVTDEPAELQIEGQPAIHRCRVRNMSKGGVYVELERSVALRIGDLVSVRIHLNKVGRVYTVKGRVAWVHQRGTGVQFLVES